MTRRRTRIGARFRERHQAAAERQGWDPSGRTTSLARGKKRFPSSLASSVPGAPAPTTRRSCGPSPGVGRSSRRTRARGARGRSPAARAARRGASTGTCPGPRPSASRTSRRWRRPRGSPGRRRRRRPRPRAARRGRSRWPAPRARPAGPRWCGRPRASARRRRSRRRPLTGASAGPGARPPGPLACSVPSSATQPSSLVAAREAHDRASGEAARVSQWNAVGTPLVEDAPNRARTRPTCTGCANAADHFHRVSPGRPVHAVSSRPSTARRASSPEESAARTTSDGRGPQGVEHARALVRDHQRPRPGGRASCARSRERQRDGRRHEGHPREHAPPSVSPASRPPQASYAICAERARAPSEIASLVLEGHEPALVGRFIPGA